MDVDPYLLQRTLFHALTRVTKPIIFQCVDFVLVADRSADSEDQATQLLAKCIIAVAISHLKDHQPGPRLSSVFERWLNSATFANTNHGQQRASMKMINLVRLVRVLNSTGRSNWDEIFGKALLAVAEFEEVEGAADEYKMEFCILWNRLLDAASADDESNASRILPHIHNVYTALHEGTEGTDANKYSTHDSIPARYTRCTISTHYLTLRATSPSSLKIARGSGEAHTLRRRFSLPPHVGLPAA
ncbi:hypothetical protein BC826DRAFT_1035781 [Russula brevipes]|nr:hypothetical protein BC826DRAFT_1035781 [Russula brevipes]